MPQQTPIAGSVALESNAFYAAFPAFKGVVSDEQVAINFRRAERFVDNTPASIISDMDDRQEVLYDLTAFYLVLVQNAVTATPSAGEGRTGGTLEPGMVGSLTSAHEGSVGVGIQSLQSGNASGTEKFLMQNQFGAMAWQIIQRYLHGPLYETVGLAWDAYSWP